MRLNPYSITVLVTAGFLLVALPLVVAILSTHALTGQLARTTAAAFSAGVASARDAQILQEQMTATERNARQYQIVGDPVLMMLVRDRQTRMLDILDRLDAHLGEPAPEAAALRSGLPALVDALALERDTDLSGFERLHPSARALSARVNEDIDAAVVAGMRQAEETREMLLGQTALLIPLAAVIAFIFVVLIVRPIRALAKAIRQLGHGDRQSPVRVSGPADFRRLGAQLEWLRVRLAEVEQEKARFLRHVSHELKTPLANIREGSELLLDGSAGALGAQQAEIATILRDNGVSLQTSIENLLNFNAWQDRNAQVVRTDADIGTMLERACDAHRLAIQRNAIQMVVAHGPATWWVDEEKLQVLLDNLLSNAVKYSPQGGTIRIQIRADGDAAIIDVVDDGPGVPPDERARIFEAFFQGSRPQQGHVKGTGIGLSVVRECARMHDGHAEVITDERGGGHFRVTIPGALGG
ncbi:MAG: HAMP domain-containing protein [Xanthomonadaceae bacterium]|nr:HAMP domain-containing protein [Xanthomonadaceae bacterium]